MYLSFYLLAAAALIIVAYVVGTALARRYRRFDGEMTLTCPENHERVVVALKPARALAGEIAGIDDLTLRACTRWPERAGCDEGCLDEVGDDPHALLSRVRIAEWFEHKECVLCGQEFKRVEEQVHQPAFIDRDGALTASTEVDPRRLDLILATHLPVCWNCYSAETFRRRHPELVVESA